jgi:hypothetical protein
MDQKIQYALSYLEDKVVALNCKDVDRDEYNAKLRGKLKCINGCEARIKFTQRKNNIKFFSTWNKDGHLHTAECPYHVDYIGKIGREKLDAYFKNGSLDEGYIERSLKRKAEALQRNIDLRKIEHPVNGSMQVDIINTGIAPVYLVGDEEQSESEKRAYISSQDAEYLTMDDGKRHIHVYGRVVHAYIGNNDSGDGNKYGYINLKQGSIPVSMVMSQSFYANEKINGIDDFERFMKALIKYKEENKEKVITAIAYGELAYKKKEKGLNVLVTSPGRIIINNKTVKQIIAQGL